MQLFKQSALQLTVKTEEDEVEEMFLQAPMYKLASSRNVAPCECMLFPGIDLANKVKVILLVLQVRDNYSKINILPASSAQKVFEWW